MRIPTVISEGQSKRLLLLATTTGYQTRAFVEAAQALGLEIVFGTDRCHVLEDPWQDGALPLRFEDPEGSAGQVIDYARAHPVHAVVSVGDRPTVTASLICMALGLPYHPAGAAQLCRDKYLSRERLRAAGLEVPSFARFSLADDPRSILASGSAAVPFPCVLKPLALSASRGVIRADNPKQFVAAFERIRRLLLRPDVQVMREETTRYIQMEEYVAGQEVAIEGIVQCGLLKVLAIFDKPDPLTGPFFEETIYVTPSRLKPQVQAAVVETLERAVQALDLHHGPLHAELRIDFGNSEAGCERVWVLEVAARSIGGLCSRALRFCPPFSPNLVSLEELVIRLALGEDLRPFRRESEASGVMMIPIPQAGIYHDVKGIDQACETPGVADVIITAKPTQQLEPLPEGSSYLGFIFARAPTAQFVEQALRSAHHKLLFVIVPALPVVQGRAPC